MLPSSAHAGLTSFGVRVRSGADGAPGFSGLAADAALPLAFRLQHPSHGAGRWTGGLRPGVTGGNLVGLDSMAPGASALRSQGASGPLLLGPLLVHAGYLRSSLVGDLFAMT